jgi:hypothetical protein
MRYCDSQCEAPICAIASIAEFTPTQISAGMQFEIWDFQSTDSPLEMNRLIVVAAADLNKTATTPNFPEFNVLRNCLNYKFHF